MQGTEPACPLRTRRLANSQCLVARLADVRAFTSVNTNVDGQGRALDERLAAIAKMAGEGALLAVDASMPVCDAHSRNQGSKQNKGIMAKTVVMVSFSPPFLSNKVR